MFDPDWFERYQRNGAELKQLVSDSIADKQSFSRALSELLGGQTPDDQHDDGKPPTAA